MSNTKKPAFNADAAEEYFSDLLFYYKKTGDDIFNRDNEGRHTTNFIYSAEYQKYVGMQIAMREVLEYFSKYDLADVQEILGEDYDLDRLREQVEKVWRGGWIGIPNMGVYDIACSKCGYSTGIRFWSSDFCPNCGAPMTDKAVDMVMERLEALYEET